MTTPKTVITAAEDSTAADPIAHTAHSDLARECEKLDPAEEQALADESFAADSESPEY